MYGIVPAAALAPCWMPVNCQSSRIRREETFLRSSLVSLQASGGYSEPDEPPSKQVNIMNPRSKSECASGLQHAGRQIAASCHQVGPSGKKSQLGTSSGPVCTLGEPAPIFPWPTNVKLFSLSSRLRAIDWLELDLTIER